MDERKRVLAVKTEGPPLKRQATEDSSPSGVPLSQDDVLYFQKEAIFRQMQIYRRERDSLLVRVSEIEQQSTYHADHLRLLELWWDQLVNEISVQAGAPATAASAAVPKSLLLSAPEEYAGHLASKRAQIVQSLEPIFASLRASRTSAPEPAELLERVSDLQAQLTVLKTENERLRDERQDLSRRLTDATFKFMSAEKKLDRLKSTTLAKIERPLAKPDEDRPEPDKRAADEVDDKLAARLQKEAEAVVRKQRDEIKTLQDQIARLTDELTKATARLGMLSEADVQAAEPYRTLKVRFEDASARAGHLEALNDVLKQENEKLSGERTEYRDAVAAEYKALADDLQAQLKRSEQDLIRIRSARDDLLQELSVRKARDDQKLTAAKELEELAATRAARIAALELEVDRLKAQLEAEPAAAAAGGAADGAASSELVKQLEKLEKQNQFLAAELPGLESAFNQAHAQSTRRVADVVEREDKMGRLLAEKAKADQKYFAAMRAKEAGTLENKALKAQVQKSGEIIQQLRDAEKAVSQKVALLEKHVAELETVRHAYQKQLQESARKCGEQAASVDSAKAQLERMAGELQSRTAAARAEAEARVQAEEKVERLRVQVEQHKAGGGAQNGDSSQIEALRAIAICSVCSRNWKNTCIKVCGHCFCFECAKDRLDARLRKCPLCNKPYSQSDLMTVHL